MHTPINYLVEKNKIKYFKNMLKKLIGFFSQKFFVKKADTRLLIKTFKAISKTPRILQHSTT